MSQEITREFIEAVGKAVAISVVKALRGTELEQELAGEVFRDQMYKFGEREDRTERELQGGY